MTHHDHNLQRQIELEIEMSGLGRDRYLSKVRKNIDKERGYDTDTGRCILQSAIGPVADGLRAFQEEAFSGRPGPKHRAVVLTKDMDPEVVSYLACRAILGRMLKPRAPVLMTLAVQVSRAVELEARFTEFKRQNKEKFAWEMRRLSEQGANEQHKAHVLTYAMGKCGIEWDRWSRTDMIHLGVKLVELFCEHTGLAVIQQAVNGGDKEAPFAQYLVHLTDRANAWVDQSVRGGELLFPAYLPTLVPPKRWVSLSSGGYFTDLDRPLPLVRKARKEQRELLAKADLSVVYRGLNAIQETPWSINGPVLDVMKVLAKSDAGIAGLVPGDKPLPDKPADIDTNKEARREWKWAARDVYAENLQLKQDRLKQGQMLDLAERFRDEAAIFFPHNLDFRGRAYPVPEVLHPQGSDPVKGLLRFAEGKPLGQDGERWLAIHGANCFGIDKVSFDERVGWVEEHCDDIYYCAEDPYENRWWTEADKPWCFLAFCFEWARLYEEGYQAFVSHLPIALDGSCNGLQHFSATLLDSVGGAAVNLIPAEKPQDIYQVVADRVNAQLRLIVSGNGVNTCASWLVQAGVDLKRIQNWLGHKRIETTLKYAKLGTGDLDLAGDILGNMLEPAKPALRVVENGDL
ncbi:DNA-directed RNA polymerase [Mesorhizobium sp. SP-1A]|uniref:DNA-directed RNA polymerase n=1 Tax=Mesorhizobium sp. SP-1A TaxID=3077840 RepID=UPI0028F70403|nr:DNA-directed RNA polymerase [Mesorhizobium sp. SP-1A]